MRGGRKAARIEAGENRVFFSIRAGRYSQEPHTVYIRHSRKGSDSYLEGRDSATVSYFTLPIANLAVICGFSGVYRQRRRNKRGRPQFPQPFEIADRN